MSKPHLQEIYFDPEQIIDFEAFEADRNHAYDLPTEDRIEGLSELIRQTETKAGDSMLDALLESVTADETLLRSEQAVLKAAKYAGKTVVVAQFDTDNTELKGVFIRRHVPEDIHATHRSKAMADRVGYGPKMNNTSFRTGFTVPHPRKG